MGFFTFMKNSTKKIENFTREPRSLQGGVASHPENDLSNRLL